MSTTLSSIVVVTIGTPNFTVPATTVFRGGYLWVPKKDVLRCAQLLVGYQASDVEAWYNRASQTPAWLTHAALFDIPDGCMGASPHLQVELGERWARLTDSKGQPFGVPKTCMCICPIEAATTSSGNAAIGLAIADRWYMQKERHDAESIHCRYLSGLEDEQDHAFWNSEEHDVPIIC